MERRVLSRFIVYQYTLKSPEATPTIWRPFLFSSQLFLKPSLLVLRPSRPHHYSQPSPSPSILSLPYETHKNACRWMEIFCHILLLPKLQMVKEVRSRKGMISILHHRFSRRLLPPPQGRKQSTIHNYMSSKASGIFND